MYDVKLSEIHLVRVGTEVFESTLEKIEFAVSRQKIVSGEQEVKNDPEKGDTACDSNFDASSKVFWADSDEVDPA